MGNLTDFCPKPLLKVCGTTILENSLNSLPEQVCRIFIVVGYLGGKIRDAVGPKFNDISVNYIEQKRLSGTASALWEVKKYLTGRFLVLSADNWYSKSDLERCISYPLSFGVRQVKKPIRYAVAVGKKGLFEGFECTNTLSGPNPYLATGTYVLDTRIFDFDPVRLESGQLGLPQTTAVFARENPVKAVLMENWFSVNTPEDLIKLERRLRCRAIPRPCR